MATKKKEADKSPKEESVKKLAASDLSTEELQQAIDKQATQTGDKSNQGSTASSDKKDAQAEPTAGSGTPQKEDSGVPIIVRRNNSYMSHEAKETSAKAATESSDASPTVGEKVIKPPSETTAKPTPASVPEPDQQAQSTTKENKATSETTAEPKPTPSAEQSAVPPAETKTAAPVEEKGTSPTSTPPSSSDVAPSTLLGGQIDQLATDANKPKEDKAQKPTVFDTTQYHLPIKPRSTNYVNNAVAWTVLVLVLIGVGGYVMYRLDILDLGRFGL